VTHVDLHHNHEVTEDIFRHYPESCRLNVEEAATLASFVDLRVRPGLLQHMVQQTTQKAVTKHDINNVVRKIGAVSGKSKVDLLADEVETVLKRDPTAAL